MRRHPVGLLAAVLLLRPSRRAGSEADRERQPMIEWGEVDRPMGSSDDGVRPVIRMRHLGGSRRVEMSGSPSRGPDTPL